MAKKKFLNLKPRERKDIIRDLIGWETNIFIGVLLFIIGLIVWAIVAGFMSVLLMLYSIEKKNDHFFLFSLMFLIISWSGIEWALWLKGFNLFEMVLTPIVPLASYFVGWTVFVIYVSEKYFKRKYWIIQQFPPYFQ